ncbi:MAG: TetR/AcrR family transcriptional regulator [Novosphingobium sp.]|jgi:AcrR family transcriptional regulator|uniref:TetR/AcrR family transcriptional regulator n=1 Tax=Novosphingobium sp. TaxID=1874826 RepID=UPI003918C751
MASNPAIKTINQRPQTRLRAEQSRALETRETILNAALEEFGEYGFEGANVRRIAQRAGIKHQLIGYHFGSKDDLWQETASHFLSDALDLITRAGRESRSGTATDLLKQELRAMLGFHFSNPKIQRLVMQELIPGNPRLTWLVNGFLRPIRKSQTALLDAAQDEGGLVDGDTMLIFYLLVGIVTIVPTMQEEIRQNTGLATIPDKTLDEYWALIERLLFPVNRGSTG